MGVHRDHRRARIGRRLLDVTLAWAAEATALDWVDLEVISTNASAIRLYEMVGFQLAAEISDMFRIDGQTLGSRTMFRNGKSLRRHDAI